MVMLPTGQEAEARDDTGLLLDTRLYAKKDCNHCYGRGTLQLTQPIPIAAAMKLVAENPANEALMQQRKPGKFSTQAARMCGCAKLRFRNRRNEFIAVLVREKLARISGIRMNAHNEQEQTVELL